MLFEKLTDKDRDLIQHYLWTYAENDGSTLYRDIAPLDKILGIWSENKEWLYRLFGDNFILEKQIEYTEPASALETTISRNLSYGLMRDFSHSYWDWLRTLNLDNYGSEYETLCGLMYSETLACERLQESHCVNYRLPITIDFGDGHKIKLEGSTKPMRAIGKIVKMCGLDAEKFETFRLEHSRIHNTKKVTGKLCLSIHPLDYMTMSMNSEGWTSCMNWQEPGGYRGGTIETMNSETTIVAYIKSDNNAIHYASCEWNSKKWRVLMTVSPTALISIKAYPYQHAELSKMALEWLAELANTNCGMVYGKPVELSACCDFEYEPTGQWYNVDYNEGSAMYCDWGCSRHYGCFTMMPDEKHEYGDAERLRINYCGPRICLCCGHINGYYYDESYVICENCCSNADEECYYCDDCGDRIYEDETYWVGDVPYCDHCVDNVAARCVYYGDYYYYENLEKIYLARTPDKPDPDEDEFCYIEYRFCHSNNYSYDRHTLPSYWATIDHPHETDDGIYYLNAEDMKTRGYREMYEMWSDECVARYFED